MSAPNAGRARLTSSAELRPTREHSLNDRVTILLRVEPDKVATIRTHLEKAGLNFVRSFTMQASHIILANGTRRAYQRFQRRRAPGIISCGAGFSTTVTGLELV